LCQYRRWRGVVGWVTHRWDSVTSLNVSV
jgi:hypothetical protein